MNQITSELLPYYQMNLIDRDLGEISSGKEAVVYLVAKENKHYAIKVFKERTQRSFQNRSDYEMQMIPPHRREARAVRNKSSFGRCIEEALWQNREVSMLKLLFDIGADVPKVYAAEGNSFMMDYFGTPAECAYRLIDYRRTKFDAHGVFARVVRNVRLFLDNGIVHGDLSAYNILFHNGQTIIIDFPQAVKIEANDRARFLFDRDIKNLCRFFRKQGPAVDADDLASRLWNECVLKLNMRPPAAVPC